MVGIFLSYAKNFITDSDGKFGGAIDRKCSEIDDWEDDLSDDEDVSNSNAEQSPDKDKALFA